MAISEPVVTVIASPAAPVATCHSCTLPARVPTAIVSPSALKATSRMRVGRVAKRVQEPGLAGRAHVPHKRLACIIHSRQPPPAGMNIHGQHGLLLRVGQADVEGLGGARVQRPDADGLIGRGAGQDNLGRARRRHPLPEGQVAGRLAVAPDHTHQLLVGAAPDVDRSLIRAGGDGASVRAEGRRKDKAERLGEDAIDQRRLGEIAPRAG